MKRVPCGDVHLLHFAAGCWLRKKVALQELSSLREASGSTVLFVNTKDSQVPIDSRLREALATSFGVPAWFWTKKSQEASGYWYYNNSSDNTAGNSAPRPRHISVFRFIIKYSTGAPWAAHEPGRADSYDWHRMSFVTLYRPSTSTATLLCIDVPAALEKNIQQALMDMNSNDVLLSHPFAYHELILEHVVDIYDQAIWAFRDYVRNHEKHRPLLPNPRPDYVGMHELARHVMHSSEVSATALNVIESMLDSLSTYRHHSTAGFLDPAPEIRRQKSLLQCMNLRSKALEERLRNEINLAFHISAQADSLIAAKIAHAAQVDSSAMKTLSFLGLVFLPGTFISALFSMSFFNFTPATEDRPEAWRISNRFWIYFVVTVPVTMFTVGAWAYWQRNVLARLQKSPLRDAGAEEQEKPGSMKYPVV
ncbi:uncharacterized protein RCC_05291 [Ramularia collo-cygni]|uniref:Uncharacterized protein n=1 Tax=Ramularia collo-cygni TaxID=112498 RepID=A0A2D3V1U5_9PEZI|nr:uncharacterized protein RCC_05291 [Ramularia collo-cygni]CZT19440.1 uncharacterized protein RCC_05291 [Ramularia collo-cygni]